MRILYTAGSSIEKYPPNVTHNSLVSRLLSVLLSCQPYVCWPRPACTAIPSPVPSRWLSRWHRTAARSAGRFPSATAGRRPPRTHVWWSTWALMGSCVTWSPNCGPCGSGTGTRSCCCACTDSTVARSFPAFPETRWPA